MAPGRLDDRRARGLLWQYPWNPIPGVPRDPCQAQVASLPRVGVIRGTMAEVIDRLRAALADRYAIEAEAGAGGMATVYRAEDLRHHRTVAIKVLRPELAATLGPERFLREIEIAASLSHPNIVPLHDSGEADGFLFYVMPWIEGETLRGRLKRTPRLPLDEAIQHTREVADALAYAHGRGLIHRDIKPENVLFQAGHAVVADFGIARATADAGKLTGTGVAIGTLEYMSPEQATGERELDGRSDVYALGCVLYEMLAGNAPFRADSSQALIARKLVGQHEPLTTLRPDVPPTVEAVVESALAVDPEQRPRTPTEFIQSLVAAASSITVERDARRRVRSRFLRLAGAVVLVASLVGGGVWLSGRLGGPAVERLAVLPLANLTGDPDQEYFAQGMLDALISELQRAGVPAIARTTVMRYKDAGLTIREIAGELNLDAVIEGSVFRSGDTVSVDVRLIDGRTEALKWSGTYDRALRDVRQLHRDVTRAIAREVRVSLTPAAETRLADARPVDPEIYDMLLRGHFHWQQFTPQDLETALRYFQAVDQRDPGNPQANASLAMIWASMGVMGVLPARVAGPRWSEAAHRAYQSDSTDTEARFAMAVLRYGYEWDFAGAEALFRAVLEANPSHPEGLGYYSHLLTVMGRPDEGTRLAERAVAVDPLNGFVRTIYGIQLQLAARYEASLEPLREAIRMAPNNPLPRWALWHALHWLGREDEAIVAATGYFRAAGVPPAAAALEETFRPGGYRQAMNAAAGVMEARARQSYVKPLQMVSLYDQAGRTDEAIGWLEEAVDARDADVVYIGVRRYSEALRREARFRELVSRVGVPLAGEL